MSVETVDMQDQEHVPEHLREPHDMPVQMVLRKVWGRLNELNEHFVMAIVGREGVGKSYTAVKLGTLLDDEFTHDQVFFRAEEFLKLLRDEEYREGAVYVLDEAGVSFGKRTWQDRAQRVANQALQLIRSHNVGLIFTLPRLGELDSQTEGRLQAFYEIVDKEPEEYVEGKWKWIDPDRSNSTGTIYKKYPRTRWGNRVRRIEFTPPPDDVVKPYEERKKKFQREVYDEAIGELGDGAGETADEDDDDDMSLKDIAAEIQSDGVERFVTTHAVNNSRYVDKDLIQVEYELSLREARRVKKLVERDWEPEDEASTQEDAQ